VPGPDLVGRSSECEQLDGLLADIRAQHSRVLVIRGEPGIGKSALLDHLEATSSGCRVIRAAGVESEMELAFAGLHQLCAPLLELVDQIPDPQRQALHTAFGLAAGEAADRFLVGLAVLSLLAAAAEEQPLVCIVDDVQWLDEVSAQTLAFVARRLLAEAVALVFAVRQPTELRVLDGLPDRVLDGLRNPDARVLLDMARVGRLDEGVRDRILEETRGNPLALLELPRGMSAAELAGGFALPVSRPLAGQIEETFMRRVERLPDATRRLLLVAAAEPLGDVGLLHGAAARLGIRPEAIVPAQDDGLIEVGVRVRFRHPLVRAAAYRAASTADRRGVHEALAEATAEEDPDRQAWHRAHAAMGPDEGVAQDLERSAERAKSRGGYAAAAAFLERALALTTDLAHRATRAIAAAEAKFEAAAFDSAEELLAAVEIGPLDDLQRARAGRLRAQIVYERQRGEGDARRLLDAAQRLTGLDDDLARETYLEALGAAIFAGQLGVHPSLREVAELARSAPPSAQPPLPRDLMLDGIALRFSAGYVEAVADLKGAIQACRLQAQTGGIGCTRWFWLAWLIAGELWDDAAQHELATMAVAVLREAGALAQLPHALIYSATAHIFGGELDTAEALIAESSALTAITGKAPLRFADAVLVGWRGNEEAAVELMTWAVDNATERGEGRAVSAVGYVLSVLYNGLARYDEALAGVAPAIDHDHLLVRNLALPELIEAAARSGSTETAIDALAELERRATASGTDWALGLLARSRALVSDGDAAEACYLEAIERLSRSRAVLDLARAHLVYGEWLRRENRRTDARDHLRPAYDTFVRSGVQAFAERARRELVATGERTAEHPDAPGLGLTPQESQIAALAAAGRTNPEIGSELFISPRTVEYHLSKVFSKLGVSSRRELRRLRLGV
jgi:DNA-binding CsgD family transcriptional regulator